MQLLKQKFSAFCTLALILFICFGVNTASAEAESNDNALTHTNLKQTGLYLGFTPCDGCQGIKTTLALNKNNSYVFITQYVGKSDREFVEKGKFSVGDDGKTLVLTPKKGSTAIQQYLIDEDMLIKLDEDGNRITKDNADRYILRRRDVISKKDAHSSH